jgi:hypothetical protein
VVGELFAISSTGLVVYFFFSLSIRVSQTVFIGNLTWAIVEFLRAIQEHLHDVDLLLLSVSLTLVYVCTLRDR